MSFYSRTTYGYSFGLFFGLANTNESQDICHNIINIAKEHASNIIMVLREDETGGGNADRMKIFSDCNQGKCFKSLSITDIAEMCKISSKNKKSYYRFFILW